MFSLPQKYVLLIFSLTESIMQTNNAVLTFKSVDEILWCDHSNETSLAVLLHGAICFSIFYKMKFDICLEFYYLALVGIRGLKKQFSDSVSMSASVETN